MMQSQPLHAVKDGLHGFRRGSFQVRVFDAENELAAEVARIRPREQRGAGAIAGAAMTRGALTVRVLPFVTQPDYDRLLWACDLNFVRGEDSWVRAQWAGVPFVWHIYPQDNALHHVKLRAFLQRYADQARSPGSLSLLWNGVTHGGAEAISVGYGLFFGSLVILPLWLQTQLGYTATEAGKVMAPVGILAIIMSPIVGKLLPKIDARLVATTAFLIFALIFYMRAQFTQNVDFYTLMVPTVIQGAAMAMFFIPLTSIILSGQPHDKIPAAAGLSNFVRIMFGGIGTSVVSTMWDDRSILHHAQLAEYTGAHNQAFTQAVHHLMAQGLSEERAWAVIDRSMTLQASTLGATDMFWISSILFLALIGFVWLTKPDKSAAPADAAGAH
jgi:hypothetical protein